jgi:hypothetical protein
MNRERWSQGYQPPAELNFWKVLGGLALWAFVLIVFVFIALPLLDWAAGLLEDSV